MRRARSVAHSPEHTVATPVAEERGEKPDAFTALGSPVRLRILDALTRGEKTITQLSRAMHLHRVTLHYHLSRLLAQGLVEELPPAPGGKVGRPSVRYRAAPHAVVPGFPPRRFSLLAKAALETLTEAVGEDRAMASLRKKGMEMGQALVEGAAPEGGGQRWDAESFERRVLRDTFERDGAAIEVVFRSPRQIRYRVFTCPFLELAEAFPEMVCGALDEGFHKGMDRALGAVRSERRSCIAHGAPYCEYAIAWGAGSERRGRRPPVPG